MAKSHPLSKKKRPEKSTIVKKKMICFYILNCERRK